MKLKNILIFAGVFVVTIVVDQILKWQTYYVFRELIPNVLSVHFVRNFGAAFSWLEGMSGFLITVTILLTLAAGAFYFFKLHAKNHILMDLGFGFFIGGAVGNLIDRIFFGYVRDFIRLDFVNFPIFNMADIFINIGVVLIVIYLVFIDKDKSFFKKAAIQEGGATGTEEAKEAKDGKNND